MIHKNTDDLSDLQFILNNQGHGVNKNKVSILCKESKQGQHRDVLGPLKYKERMTAS